MSQSLLEYDNNVVTIALCWKKQCHDDAENPLRNSNGNELFKCTFPGCTVTRATNSGGSNLLLHTVEKHMESLKELYAAHKAGNRGPMVQYVWFISISSSQEDLRVDEINNFDQPICEFGNEQRSP